MDVVQRYDVDGITFDDYFYPYPEKDAEGRKVDFPDDASWRKYGAASGLSRDDWRRAERQPIRPKRLSFHQGAETVGEIRHQPVRHLASRFPNQIKGLDAYAKIYADSRKWLANGWVDYFAPQLYWSIDPREQSFPALLQWWSEQNAKHRHLWPSLNAANVGTKWKPDEIARQMQIARRQPGVSGEIIYHLRNLSG